MNKFNLGLFKEVFEKLKELEWPYRPLTHDEVENNPKFKDMPLSLKIYLQCWLPYITETKI